MATRSSYSRTELILTANTRTRKYPTGRSACQRNTSRIHAGCLSRKRRYNLKDEHIKRSQRIATILISYRHRYRVRNKSGVSS